MRIGFSLDNVVVDTIGEIERYISVIYGLDWRSDYLLSYDFSTVVFCDNPKLNKEIIHEITDNMNSFIFKAMPVEGAVDVLKQLKRSGHELFFISNRPKDAMMVTLNWFTKTGIQYDRLEIIGNNEKGIYGKKYNLDMFVDTIENNLLSLLRYKKRWFKGLYIFDRPWNHDHVDGSKFKRVYTWKNILRYSGVPNRFRIDY